MNTAGAVGVLLGAEDPLGGYALFEMQSFLNTELYVLFDSKTPSHKDNEIYKERTGSKLKPLFAEKICGKHDFVENHNSDEAITRLRKNGCDLILNLGTPRILTSKFINSFTAVINCHPGLLPKYRGCSAVEWSIFNGDPVGNTVHLMDSGIDTGRIISREIVNLSGNEDYISIRVQVYLAGYRLFAKTVHKVLSGDIDLGNLPNQDEGQYWGPIPPEQFKLAQKRVANKSYFKTCKKNMEIYDNE